MLEMCGYAVKTAKNDEQGIEMLKRGGVDLILSRLPGIVGAVKAKGLLIPTVFIAGYAAPGKTDPDIVLMQERQSPVEVLAAVKGLLNEFKLKRQQ